MTKSWRRRRDEAGYAAILVALLASTVFIGLAALGVDTARWYVEVERLQKAADAAALAGVTYMPNDLTSARATALSVARRNGYTDSGDTHIVVTTGERPSQLKVSISSVVDNAFGGSLGVDRTRITRSGVADYTAPAPMGSPCNLFGNEPPSGGDAPGPSGTALPSGSQRFPNCTQTPQFWAAAEGPETDKVQGDRYNTRKCNESGNAGRTYGCAGSNGDNTEYRDDGYFFAVHVEPEAVGTDIDVQVYDPAFVYTSVYCNTGYMPSGLRDNMNPFTDDGKTRYAQGNSYGNGTGQQFCTGDTYPGSSTTTPVTTTYVMRGNSDTGNPLLAPPVSGCTTQFRGFSRAPSYGELRSNNGSYDEQLSQVWHQWYSLCNFRPTQAGNYFLQVRTNVSLGGSSSSNTHGNQPVIYHGNSAATAKLGNTSTGAGANAFALRAVPSNSSLRNKISVSGWERMPVLQIAPQSTATFNLVRALPNARGNYLTFDFYDAADGSNGTVKVLAPPDATGSVKAGSGVPGCRQGVNDASPATYTLLSGCSVNVSGSYTDGQVVHMVIPLPNDYNCDPSTLGGCWFQVRMSYSGAVTDLTTWSANIGGDPVRLIE